MTPYLLELHQKSKRFHAEIARRSSLVLPKVVRTYDIPNTSFGTPKVKPVPVRLPSPQALFWHTMWFFDLVTARRPREKQALTISDVQRATASHFGISMNDMLSARRDRRIVRPRQVGYYLSKRLTLKSLPEIGRRFGGRDHTSILSGVRKIEALRKTDPQMEADVNAIASLLGGSISA